LITPLRNNWVEFGTKAAEQLLNENPPLVATVLLNYGTGEFNSVSTVFADIFNINKRGERYADHIHCTAGYPFGIIMVGATVTHIRAKDPGKDTTMPIIFLILSVVVAVLNWTL